MRSLKGSAVACFVWLVFLPAASLSAQACLGYPTPAGQFSINPAITFAENATAFGGTFNANLPTELGFEAGFGVTSVDGADDNGIGFSGRVGYELDTPQLSACPFAGLGYSTVDDLSALSIPIGFGAGTTLPAGDYQFTLSGAPQLMFVRTSVDNGDSETDTDFGLALGATLGTDRYYGGFTLTLSTADGNDTVFGISMGFILGQ